MRRVYSKAPAVNKAGAFVQWQLNQPLLIFSGVLLCKKLFNLIVGQPRFSVQTFYLIDIRP
jgi:hypothetical protein